MAIKKTPKADIKGRSRRIFEASLLASLLIMIAAFTSFPDVDRERAVLIVSEDIIQLEDVDNTRQENLPPPPPRPVIPIESQSDDPLPDVMLDLDPDLTEITPPKPSPVSEPEEADDGYFEAVEDNPSIIGGMEEVLKHLVYPDLAIRAGVHGTVHVVAYVNKQGVVTRTEILRGIGGGCDEAAMDAVKKVSFEPGMQRGKPVNVTVPVKFLLK